MNRLNSYAVIVAVVLVGGYLINDTPEMQDTYGEDRLIARIQAQAPVAEKIKPEIKTYKKNEQLSPNELKDILYQVGFRGDRLREAWGTAMKESTGRPRSHNDNPDTGDNSYGLFQINMIDSLGPARRKQFNLESNKDLFDPVRNAEIAFFMSNGGKNWSSWHGITDRTLEWMQEFPKD